MTSVLFYKVHFEAVGNYSLPINFGNQLNLTYLNLIAIFLMDPHNFYLKSNLL